MNIKKSALAILLTLTLSACSETNITDVETEPSAAQTETSTTPTETAAEVTEEETAAETSAEQTTAETTREITETETADEKSISKEKPYDYLRKKGFKVSSSGLYIDMNDYWDTYDPLADVDEAYLKNITYLTVENAGSRDLSFLNKYYFSWLTLEGYSGNADFNSMRFKVLVLDDYRGGDLSTVSEHIAKDFGGTWLRFKNYSGNEDLSFFADMDTINSLCFEYYDDRTDFGFISECPNIKHLVLKNRRIDAENLAETLKNTNIKSLGITVEEYSSDDADIIMRAVPKCSISYERDSDPWDSERELQNHLLFFTNLYVDTEAESNWEEWDCRFDPDRVWQYHGSLINTFNNYTEEVQHINSVEILKNDNGTYTPLPFADGSLVYEIDLTLDAGETSDFEMTEEIFPFGKYKPGVYKIAFNSDSQRLEQPFAICSSDRSFLTAEQQEILDKACEITGQYFGCSTYMPQEYADTHTAEEFLENLYPAYTREYAYSESLGTYIDKNGKLQAAFGDRGGDITVCGHFFMPVYSDEKEVILKNFVVHAHSSDPYFIWFEELNYHIVKTDDGWRFDNFRVWY